MAKNIQNPGSALGEAIGAQMELALNNFFVELVDNFNCYFISKGPVNKNTGKHKKLLMSDQFDNDYNIDSVIVNEAMQPLLLVESKYIRYTKHNRDKGSWICTAHTALRNKYTSIRSSIAVLAGSWSSTSVAMIKSHGTNVFLIPFELICELLQSHSIDFNWDEKDRKLAIISWEKYCALSDAEKYAIGLEMVNHIKDDLQEIVTNVLDENAPRSLEEIILEFHTNIGERFIHHCVSIEDALDILTDFNFEELLDTSNSPSIFDKQ